MKLTGPEILRRREIGEIVIEPFDAACVNPNSYNLHLGNKLVVYDCHCPFPEPMTEMHRRRRTMRDWDRAEAQGWPTFFPRPEPLELSEGWDGVLDMAVQNPVLELTIPVRGLVLIPGRLYLGSTVEYTETHGLVPCIDGRSSIGRLGISIHATAGFGDVGFRGCWTLEISVVEPVRVYPNVAFCQISYETILGDVVEYNSVKYQGQREIRPSGIWREFQRKEQPCNE